MRRLLPSGTVTFVFTDISGSTTLLNELGDERYAHALAEHRETLRSAFTRHGGIEVGTEGDSFFIAFPTAHEALSAVSDGMHALEQGQIRVRAGIHTGTPLLMAEDYVGIDVHRASRIASVGHGGQVLVSATTAALVDADRFELKDLGYHRLKDLTRPERIFQLGPNQFPPIKSLSPSNLPVPTTVFLGRRHEVDRVNTLLVDPDVRVLTLTGPGGTGKTRLAIEAAAESSDAFPDGLWWVPLASLTDPSLALSAIAKATSVEEGLDGVLVSDLAARLASGRSLVLLDNAEHLLPLLAVELAPVVRDAKGATFLVTSRAALHLDAEREFQVPAMTPEDAELFVTSRAAAIGVELEPSSALSTLCERLDHLPLAMLLAVARLKLFSVDQLVDRLSHVLDLPGLRDADPRQQTLRATIEWSHSLLSAAEAEAFRRLSIFSGGATMEAIEDVTATDPATLSALLDQSLVFRRDGPLGPRIWMLETIREFALERLLEAGEMGAMQQRHARFYRTLAEHASADMDRARGDWLAVLDAELENLRATLTWCLDRDDHEFAQVVAGSLGIYWLDRGLLQEMRTWLARSLEAGNDHGPAHTLAVSRLAVALYLQGDYAESRAKADEALADARTIGDPAEIVRAMEIVASVLEAEGSLKEAWELEKDALDIARGFGPARSRLHWIALNNLGYTSINRAMHEEAVQYLEESVELALGFGELRDVAAARCNLAMALIQLGQVDEAGRLSAEATMFAIDGADPLLGSDCLEVLAAVETQRGNHRFAARLLGSAEAIRKSHGYVPEPAERDLHKRTTEVLRSTLATSELATEWATGSKMDLDEAFALIGREYLEGT
jgi:predicted ATPase/class 3 adenylate cyclase